ncbi:MbcA/ParS/Xre antitoxin family protein [Candidatus Gracilibacteria bacterium]|nr:MbcA/ParS/Xre antitoxin family protein [Candidatus Gracilibacteria bacterium]
MYSEISETPEIDIPRILGFTSENHTIESIRRGISTYNRDFEDRLYRLSEIKNGIATIVSTDNITAQRKWFNAPQQEFNGKTALDMITDETMCGINTVNSVIIRILG